MKHAPHSALKSIPQARPGSTKDAPFSGSGSRSATGELKVLENPNLSPGVPKAPFGGNGGWRLIELQKTGRRWRIGGSATVHRRTTILIARSHQIAANFKAFAIGPSFAL